MSTLSAALADSSLPPKSSPLVSLIREEIELQLRRASSQLAWAAADPEKLAKLTGGMAREGISLTAGADYTGQHRTLYLAVPETFPTNLPTAFILPQAYQVWPHAEASGRLCVWQRNHRPDTSDIPGLVSAFLSRVGDIVGFSQGGSNPEHRRLEFEDEWLSYWAPPTDGVPTGHYVNMITAPSATIQPLYQQTLIRHGDRKDGQGRAKKAWNPVTLLATDPQALMAWGKSFKPVSKPDETASGLYIPLQHLSAPGMPRAEDLFGWLLECGGVGAVAAVQKALSAMNGRDRQLTLVFGLQTKNGVALNGLVLESRLKNPIPPRGYRSKAELRHAREHATADLLAWLTRPLIVFRADPDWMRDRCVDKQSGTLRGKHVVLAGCGMLGSPIAEGLSRAGVGKLTLIDPDDLDPANIGRHVLGATYVHQPKAAALADHIGACVPSIEVVPITKDVASQDSVDVFGPDVDLVICATVDWRSERFLFQERQRRENAPPLLVCWLESFAAAGHALLSLDPGDDLASLFDYQGHFLKPCTDWPGGPPEHRVAACQATFQPAGMVAAAPFIAQCSSLALDYLLGLQTVGTNAFWFTTAQRVEAVGGKLAPMTRGLAPRAFHERSLFP